MARFTRIPETNIAGTLGGIVGQAAGTVIGSANLSLEKLQAKLDLSYQKALNGDPLAYVDLSKIENNLNTIDKSISKVEKVASGLEKTVTTIRVPIVGLEVAVNIIKYLPLPQMYLVTSVSALQADLVQMLLELIAQIKQIILTLQTVVKVILDLLKKLKDWITKLRQLLAALKACKALSETSISEHDQEVLENMGVLTSDGNIFEKLTETISRNSTDIIWVGNYKGIDTGSVEITNQVKSAEPGTTIKVITGPKGTWITYAFKNSETKPEKPVSRLQVPEGWSDTPTRTSTGQTWYTKGQVAGLSGKVTSWSEPREFKATSFETNQIKPIYQPVNVFKLTKNRFNTQGFNMQEANAILLTGPEEGYQTLVGVLQQIDNAPLSPELKKELQIEINPQENQSDPSNTEDYFISNLGDVYRLTLKESSVSPKIATLRYVEVTDKDGTIVYEGSQTFATDPKVLFEETKVRLTQLLG